MVLPGALTSLRAETSFGGYEAAQSWSDLALWEEFLNRYTPAALVELGTWSGGMAAFFGFQGLARGMKVTTIDRNHCLLECGGLLERLGVKTLLMDLLAESAADELASALAGQPRPLMLFCDNGDKPREFRSFAPLLATGDFIAVHDWGSEIREADLEPRVPMVMAAECEAIASFTRFFQLAPVPLNGLGPRLAAPSLASAGVFMPSKGNF